MSPVAPTAALPRCKRPRSDLQSSGGLTAAIDECLIHALTSCIPCWRGLCTGNLAKAESYRVPAKLSNLAAEALCHIDHDFELSSRELSADRHEAAIGRQPDLIGCQMLEHARNTPLHRVDRRRGAVAWIDAAEHHDPVAARPEHLRIELAAAEFDGEAADARFHQFRKHSGIFVFMLGSPTEAWI